MNFEIIFIMLFFEKKSFKNWNFFTFSTILGDKAFSGSNQLEFFIV